MSGIIINSKKQKADAEQLLLRKIPSYRQAYRDRTAWIMACMSELAYIRFNPLLQGIRTEDFVNKVSSLEVGSATVSKVQSALSTFAYDHEQERLVLEKELSHLNYTLLETFNSGGTQAILVGNSEHVILAFRGTEANSIKDIKSDAKAMIKPCDSGGKIHSGFDEAYQKVSLDIELALDKTDIKDKPLFITGHSLGGALAAIAAKKITHKAGNAACYTFGAPRVGDAIWVSTIKTPLYRVVNAADCVSMLPPGSEVVSLIGWLLGLIPTIGITMKAWALDKLGGYMHGGDMRYLTNCPKGHYENVMLLYSVSWFFRVKAMIVKKLPWKKYLSDHSISVYRKKLLIVARKRNGLSRL